MGDIRHAYADISRIQKDFGYKPRLSVEEGLVLFVDWVKKQPLPTDRYNKTEKELREKGLLLEAGES
ncbi:MAG: hypothetical protein KAT62_15720 [Desulfuromonadales bacterium]|nr:hypothetical protein [Desulfuromonadales bacterium]